MRHGMTRLRLGHVQIVRPARQSVGAGVSSQPVQPAHSY